MKHLLLLFFTLFLNVFSCFSQIDFTKTKIELGTGFVISTSGDTPFWLRTNQYGVVPLKSPILTFRGRIHQNYDSTSRSGGQIKKFGYGYHLETIANVGAENHFLLPEAHLKFRYLFFEFYIGRRKEIVGLVDTLLTSGSYSWSGNALPLPKIELSIPNYTPILKNGLIAIKGNFAHGWFENDRPYTKKGKLHQKSFYVKLGKPSWRINLFTGFNHNVQWGGESPFYSIDGKLPDGFRNYIHAVLGTRGAITNTPQNLDFDANRVGNHLGSIDLGIEAKLGFGKILFYRQNFYEDGSLFYLNNIADGLNGLSISFPKHKTIRKINFEYLNTTNQGGTTFELFNAPPELRGTDNYFNNGQFFDGWSYKLKTIGTPFIWSSFEVENNRSTIFTKYNRTKTYTSAILLNHKLLDIHFRYSYSKNLGSYIEGVTPTKYLHSILCGISNNKTFRQKYTAHCLINYDNSNLFKNTLGMRVLVNRIIK